MLVWIDCEMSGLDAAHDAVLEIACVITTDELEPARTDGGFEAVIHQPDHILDSMDSWCTAQHAASGLTARVRTSARSLGSVEDELLAYIRQTVPRRHDALLAGNSVHVDRMFLARLMPSVIEHLHYRIVDVSTVKELASRWRPDLRPYPKTAAHRAMDDIRESIDELRYWRNSWLTAAGGTPAGPATCS